MSRSRRRDEEEIAWLRERVGFLEARLAERVATERRPQLDAATRERIVQRTEEILSGGDKRRAAEAKRKLAERIAYQEILAEDEQARRERAAG